MIHLLSCFSMYSSVPWKNNNNVKKYCKCKRHNLSSKVRFNLHSLFHFCRSPHTQCNVTFKNLIVLNNSQIVLCLLLTCLFKLLVFNIIILSSKMTRCGLSCIFFWEKQIIDCHFLWPNPYISLFAGDFSTQSVVQGLTL